MDRCSMAVKTPGEYVPPKPPKPYVGLSDDRDVIAALDAIFDRVIAARDTVRFLSVGPDVPEAQSSAYSGQIRVSIDRPYHGHWHFRIGHPRHVKRLKPLPKMSSSPESSCRLSRNRGLNSSLPHDGYLLGVRICSGTGGCETM